MIASIAQRAHRNERIALTVLRLAAGFVVFAMAALLVYLAFEGTKTFFVDRFSLWSFLFSPNYDVDANHPGAAIFILGTLLVPFIRDHTSSASGFSLAAAGIVLAIMILPTVISLSEDAFTSLPPALKEGSLALGATRFQTIMRVLLPSASSGIAVALILGIARAVGETLAIQLVIGNATAFPANIFAPTSTLTTVIVGEMPSATQGSLQEHALFSMAFLLLVIAMVLILLVRLALRRR